MHYKHFLLQGAKISRLENFLKVLYGVDKVFWLCFRLCYLATAPAVPEPKEEKLRRGEQAATQDSTDSLVGFLDATLCEIPSAGRTKEAVCSGARLLRARLDTGELRWVVDSGVLRWLSAAIVIV